MMFRDTVKWLWVCLMIVGASLDVEARSLYVIGNLTVSEGVWNPTKGVELSYDGSCYSGMVDFQPYGDDTHSYFAVVESLTEDADDWSARRYGADTNDFDVTPGIAMQLNDNSNSWKVPQGLYSVRVDLDGRTITVSPIPDDLFVVGNLAVSDGGWDVRRGVCLVRDGNKYSGTVEFQGYNGEPTSYFTIVTKLGYYAGDDWATVSTGSRYGASSNNAPATESSTVVAGSTEAWSISSGTYDISVDLAECTLTVSAPESVHGSGMTGGWPEGYAGVMLQSFYWDCFNDGWGWEWLSGESDEICRYFDVMWIPNFAFCDDPNAGGMGYHPINWFTNFSSTFGTEEQFRSMMNTYKGKGMDMMAEVVINHRFGFPAESWNGRTWQIGNDGIPNNDRPTPGTGNPDTGTDWELCADLDHTNANVQANVKAYEDMLVSELGFAGFRYDFVIGYAPEFIKIYNRHSGPTYSVGEYWDQNRSRVASWINGTAYQSAAFDFPGKFAISAAFRDNDMTKLVDATLAEYGYGRYSVSFIDNHDTYNEDANRFAGADDQIVAANAFMLSMPGTPCVFIVHWNRYKEQIRQLIEARKQAGITNDSPVTLLRSNKDCYMAEVKGAEGRLVVKVGPELVSPEGYRDSEIVTSGNQYCVWLKKGQNPDPDDPQIELPERLYVVGNLEGADWNTAATPELERLGNMFRTAQPVRFTAPHAYFSFITTLGATWDDVNRSSRISPSLEADADIELDTPAPFNIYTPDMAVSESKAWNLMLPDDNTAEYDLMVNFTNKHVTISRHSTTTAASLTEADAAGERYFNIYGLPVENPTRGVYIRIVDGHASKVLIR